MVAVDAILAPVRRALNQLESFADANKTSGVAVPAPDFFVKFGNSIQILLQVAAQLTTGTSTNAAAREKIPQGVRSVNQSFTRVSLSFDRLRADDTPAIREEIGEATTTLSDGLTTLLRLADEVEVSGIVEVLEVARKGCKYLKAVDSGAGLAKAAKDIHTAFNNGATLLEKRLGENETDASGTAYLNRAINLLRAGTQLILATKMNVLNIGVTSAQQACAMGADRLDVALADVISVLRDQRSGLSVNFATVSCTSWIKTYVELGRTTFFDTYLILGADPAGAAVGRLIGDKLLRMVDKERTAAAVLADAKQGQYLAACDRFLAESSRALGKRIESDSFDDLQDNMILYGLTLFNGAKDAFMPKVNAALETLTPAIVQAMQSAKGSDSEGFMRAAQGLLENLQVIAPCIRQLAGYTSSGPALLVEWEHVRGTVMEFAVAARVLLSPGGDDASRNEYLVAALNAFRAALAALQGSLGAFVVDRTGTILSLAVQQRLAEHERAGPAEPAPVAAAPAPAPAPAVVSYQPVNAAPQPARAPPPAAAVTLAPAAASSGGAGDLDSIFGWIGPLPTVASQPVIASTSAPTPAAAAPAPAAEPEMEWTTPAPVKKQPAATPAAAPKPAPAPAPVPAPAPAPAAEPEPAATDDGDREVNIVVHFSLEAGDFVELGVAVSAAAEDVMAALGEELSLTPAQLRSYQLIALQGEDDSQATRTPLAPHECPAQVKERMELNGLGTVTFLFGA